MSECKNCMAWCWEPNAIMAATGRPVMPKHHPNCPAYEPPKKYINIKLVGHGNYTVEMSMQGIGILLDEIKESQASEKWEIKIVEMFENEYKSLPEFEGH